MGKRTWDKDAAMVKAMLHVALGESRTSEDAMLRVLYFVREREVAPLKAEIAALRTALHGAKGALALASNGICAALKENAP